MGGPIARRRAERKGRPPRREELEVWIAKAWVRPDRQAAQYAFVAPGAARVGLIQPLRDELEVDEAALPDVLGRPHLQRQFRAFNDTRERVVPSDIRRRLTELLERRADASRPAS